MLMRRISRCAFTTGDEWTENGSRFFTEIDKLLAAKQRIFCQMGQIVYFLVGLKKYSRTKKYCY